MKRVTERKKRPAPTVTNGKVKLLGGSRQLSALLAIAEAASQSLDTEKIINDTLRKALEVLHFDVGYIRTLVPGTTNLVVRAALGFSPSDSLNPLVPLQSPPYGLVSTIVFETREPYTSTNVRKDPNFRTRSLERAGVASVIVVPIMSRERVMGIMTVCSRKFHRFSKQEISLLKAFGFQLGMALENAELYDEARSGKFYIENLLEHAGDAIVSTDADDTILSWNRAAEVIFGYTKEEVIGKSLAILAPQNHPTELVDLRTKVELTGPMRSLEVRRKRKDGSIFNVALAVSATKDKDGKVIG